MKTGGDDNVDAAKPYAALIRTPFAVLGIRTAGGRVTGIQYLPKARRTKAPDNALAERAVRQIEGYLADPEFRFTLPLAPADTPFRGRVREAIAAIPPGESRTYGELARLLHTAPRAVGGACGANDIALVIPCHRVVGSQGSLGGFMGTNGGPKRASLAPGEKARNACGAPICAADGDPIAIKRWLLTHEGYRFGR